MNQIVYALRREFCPKRNPQELMDGMPNGMPVNERDTRTASLRRDDGED